MNKAYQTVILYFGVFTVAYAGFFYQTYITRSEAPDTYHQQSTTWPDTDSSAPSSASTDFHSRSHPVIKNAVKHTSVNNYSGSGKTGPGKAKAKAQENRETPDEHALGGGYPAGPVNYPATQTAGSQLSISPAYSSASVSAYSTTAESTTTSSSSSFYSTASSNTTVTTGFSDTGTVTGVSTSTSTSTDSSTANNDDLPTDNGNEYQQLDAEEERWATPDCQYNLPQGSTEQDAFAMTEAYGCRYRYSCVNNNDGTGSYYCSWQYINF